MTLVESARDMLESRHQASETGIHLQAAMEWLMLAQDQTGNGGVSAGFGRSGWRPDYPETTGYTIPTFLNYRHLTSDGALL